jgi:hypothetical protein
MAETPMEGPAVESGRVKLPPDVAELLLGLLAKAMVEELVEHKQPGEMAETKPEGSKSALADRLASLKGPVPPLLHARRKPGRPRKAQCGHNPGTGTSGRLDDVGPDGRAQAMIASAPRLLDLQEAAIYLGVSPWTIRDLEAQGILHRVCIPLADGRDLRKLLFDRVELDALVESWKDHNPLAG